MCVGASLADAKLTKSPKEESTARARSPTNALGLRERSGSRVKLEKFKNSFHSDRELRCAPVSMVSMVASPRRAKLLSFNVDRM